MPKIEITQPHSVTAEEAKKRIDSLNAELGAKFDLTSQWVSECEAKVERGSTKGTIKIEPNCINVLLDLPFTMTPLKGTIEKRIKDELARLFTT